jgi:hypothetical protein
MKSSPFTKRRTTIAAVLVAVLVFFIPWLLQPVSRVALTALPHTPPKPPRPGAQGVVITGPEIKRLYFEIDASIAGQRRLGWQSIFGRNKSADVTVRAVVKEDGSLSINKIRDIKDLGYSEAGNEIYKVLRTWRYKPYKRGKILFWFNAAALQYKLTVDASNLEILPDYREYRVSNRQLFNIEGLGSNEVRYGEVDF